MNGPLAVLLPLTSRGEDRPSDVVDRVGRLAAALPSTAGVFIGIDVGDPLATLEADIAAAVSPCKAHFEYFAPATPPPIVPIASALADAALADTDAAYGLFVLLGDDLEFSTGPEWVDVVRNTFADIGARRGVPPGFGVVALPDTAFPGFPTFPIVSRLHFVIHTTLVPADTFVNQDADPFLWEVYRRWGASAFAPAPVAVTNTIGGDASSGAAPPPRYERSHVDWKHDVLAAAVARTRAWLAASAADAGAVPPAEVVVVDVIVPTVRAATSTLDDILAIDVSADDISTQFIVVVDPLPGADDRALAELAASRTALEAAHGAAVRVRVNAANEGASVSRNHGLDESAADWVIFLDDDVVPSRTIVREYAACIRKRGQAAAGFVGLSTFPRPFPSLRAAGVELSWVTYFWTAAGRVGDELAWGVTANLCTRRTRARFDARFPRTGGGEDIAYCALVRSTSGLPLRPAPAAQVVHPWWNGGTPAFSRFFGWAWGDSALATLFPEHTYRTVPNAVEMMAIVLALWLVAPLAADGPWRWWWGAMTACAIWAIDCAWDVLERTMGDARNHAPSVGGAARVWASVVACAVKTVAETGHLVAPCVRSGGGVGHIGRRFDWWMGVGDSATGRASEAAKHRWRGTAFAAAAIGVPAALAVLAALA